jgi:hypothetical protein
MSVALNDLMGSWWMFKTFLQNQFWRRPIVEYFKIRRKILPCYTFNSDNMTETVCSSHFILHWHRWIIWCHLCSLILFGGISTRNFVLLVTATKYYNIHDCTYAVKLCLVWAVMSGMTVFMYSLSVWLKCLNNAHCICYILNCRHNIYMFSV